MLLSVRSRSSAKNASVHRRVTQLPAVVGLELVHAVCAEAFEPRRPPRCHGQEHGGEETSAEARPRTVVQGMVLFLMSLGLVC